MSLRRVVREVEHIVSLQGQALQQYEKEQRPAPKDGDEEAADGSLLPPSKSAPAAMPHGYSGSVTVPHNVSSQPLLSAVVLTDPSPSDRRCTIGITVHGPPGTPWDRSLLHMLCVTPQDYPFKAPRMCFCTGDFRDPYTCKRRSRELKAVPFHPNVNENGQLDLDLLGHNWSPALVIPTVVRTCLLSLTEWNEECILNQDAERVYRRSKEQWEKEARDRIEEDWRVD